MDLQSIRDVGLRLREQVKKVVVGQDRTLDLRGERPADQRQFFSNHLPSHEDVGAPIELHPDDRDADCRRRPHTPDPRRAIDGRLDRKGDERFHLVWRHAVTFGEHRDGGGCQVREDIDGHIARDPEPRPRQQERHRDDHPVMIDRPLNQVSHLR